MAPERNELLYDQMLKSMLAPKSYMEGLVAGSADKPEDSYIVPKGMSTDLCMLAVLGAILSEDNLCNMENGSSPGSSNAKNWKKIWFIRDFPGNDEKRGTNMMKAVSFGRQKAIKALQDYENGNPSALNELIDNGSKCVKEAVKLTSVADHPNWFNTTAAVRLLNKATSHPVPMGIKEIQDEEPALVGTLYIAKCRKDLTIANEKFNALSKDAPQEEREPLLLEISAYEKIIFDFQKELNFEGYDILDELADRTAQAAFGGQVIYDNGLWDGIKASAEYKDLSKKYLEIYNKTHPGKLLRALKNPENYDEIIRQYKEQIQQSDRFTRALNDNWPIAGNAKINVTLNMPGLEVDNKEAAELQKNWELASAEYQERIVDLGKRIPQAEELLNTQLAEIANKYALHNYKVFREKSITDKGVRLTDYLNTQRSIYLYDDQCNGIVEVHSDNGKDLITTPVLEFASNPDSKNAYRDVAYANTFRPVLKLHVEYVAQQEGTFFEKGQVKPSKINYPYVCDVVKSGVELYKLLGESMQGMGQDGIEPYRNKLSEAFDKIRIAREHPEENGSYKYILNDFENFCKDVELAFTVAEKQYEKSIEHFFGADTLPSKDRLNQAQKMSESALTDDKLHEEIGSLIKVHPQGSRQTDIRLNLEALLNKAKSETAKDEELSNECEDYIHSLESLNEITNRLYQRDDNGLFKQMSEKDFADLISAYNESLRASETLNAEKTAYKHSVMPVITGRIKSMLSNDIAALTNINPSTQYSLPDAIEYGRSRRVDISGKVLSSVGEKSNKRYALSYEENGKTVKGFFTNEKKFTYGEELRPYVEKAFAGFKREFGEDGILVDHMINDYIFNNVHDRDKLLRRACDYSKTLPVAKELAEKLQISLDNIADSLYEKYINMELPEDDLATMFFQYGDEIQACKGTDITGRNIAMSKLANLFGMPEILAQSVPMELNDNGKIIKGVFMANAKGVDVDKLMPEDVESIEDNPYAPSLVADTAKIQVLDYICGNVDRNGKNMFYIFNEDKTKIIGLQGIDNDFSFGTIRRRPDYNGKSRVEVMLDDIKFMPQKLANNLMSVSDSAFSASLKETGLLQPEIAAALERLHAVKEYIALDKIKAMNEEEISKLNLPDLCKGTNTFHTVFENTNNLKHTAAENLRKKEEKEAKKEDKPPFRFEKTDVLTGINSASLKINNEEYSKFASEIANSQKTIWGKGSNQFAMLQNAVNNFVKNTQNISENPSESDLFKLRVNLEAIKECADNYIAYKSKEKKPNENAKIRLDMAKRIKEYTDTTLGEFKKEAFRQDEIKVEDMNAVIKAQAKKIQLGTAVKNLEDLQKLTREILTAGKCGEETKKLMTKGLEASEVVLDVLKGNKSVDVLNAEEADYSETMIVYGTLLSGCKNQDKNYDIFAKGIESKGADFFVKQLHDIKEMKNFKSIADKDLYAEICIEDMDYLDIKPDAVSINEKKIQNKVQKNKEVLF